jgi:hypothetical protein
MHVIKHPRRLVESAGVSNLALFLALCGGLFCRQSEMRGPFAQQGGLAETSRGRDQRQPARHTLIQSFGQVWAVILPHLVHPGNVVNLPEGIPKPGDRRVLGTIISPHLVYLAAADWQPISG